MVVFEPFKTLPLSSFREELEFEFPSLPVQLFDYYIRKTAVDMAEQAPVIRRRVYLELEPNVTQYTLRPPDGLELVSILGAMFVECCGQREARRFFDTPATGCCGPSGIWWDEQEKTLHVRQCGQPALRVTMSAAPSRDACELPQEYSKALYPILVMGTRANIMLISGQKWTNLRLGAELLNEYRRQLNQQAVEVATNRQHGSIKMQFGRVM